jgi:signal transduction histidine kinase
MQGFASMLPAVGDLNDRQKQYVDKIMSGITQMSDLVEKVLDVRKIDPDGNYQLIRTACDVARMLSEIAAQHADAAERKEQHLELDVDPNLPILNLDEVMLRRAINNLVDNAVKYTPAHGTITVSGHIEDNHLVIAIKDTGLGISEENQRLLFSQFKRIRRKEHHLIKGSGLGLFIVKGVAMRHNGDAWLTSKEHEGSTFYISIPLEGMNLLGAAEVQTTQGS